MQEQYCFCGMTWRSRSLMILTCSPNFPLSLRRKNRLWISGHIGRSHLEQRTLNWLLSGLCSLYFLTPFCCDQVSQSRCCSPACFFPY